VFHNEQFLWGFVVAWVKSEKMGDQNFIDGQLSAMRNFDEKHGVTAMAVPGRSAEVQGKLSLAAGAASAGAVICPPHM
jgi:hypothetical protein